MPTTRIIEARAYTAPGTRLEAALAEQSGS